MLFTSTEIIRLIRAYGQCPACFKGSLDDDQDCRGQELSESGGGRPGPSCCFCGCKATLNLIKMVMVIFPVRSIMKA